MNNLELFSLLKKNAEYFSTDMFPKNAPSDQEQQPFNRFRYISRLVADYNQKTFQEIKNRDCIAVIEQVDVDQYNEFTFRIDKYMDQYAPGQDDLKRYIQIISAYLTFIARKPLHPPGMIFDGNKSVIIDNNKYYCPVKNKQLQGEFSICKYCVSQDISKMIHTSKTVSVKETIL